MSAASIEGAETSSGISPEVSSAVWMRAAFSPWRRASVNSGCNNGSPPEIVAPPLRR